MEIRAYLYIEVYVQTNINKYTYKDRYVTERNIDLKMRIKLLLEVYIY